MAKRLPLPTFKDQDRALKWIAAMAGWLEAMSKWGMLRTRGERRRRKATKILKAADRRMKGAG